ncbi:pyrimidine-nucleoside phosphorylase [Companilactobacillus sp. DQM5]|uniref:pyrimidine-nucleoside phosphorylase n=1 Tax=Companilactobacillus sp. DQM5 TaxID=3463359 RepID=UPI0040598536
MRMVDVIQKKRDKKELTKEEIEFFVNGYTDGSIPDYQASALLMSIYFNDMTDDERAALTMTMLNSGDKLDLSAISGIKVDKHSTGGVGDKTSLPLAPIVAALGISVPMISGRGLGHTGGTLDKLESIPGFKVEISEKDFIKQVSEMGLAIVGATGNIAPADKKIYALRDVTDTVDSIPLIAGSIMSKKIASGTDALVLDVKTGSGAFMKSEEDAIKLANALVRIGKSVGMNCMAVISDMNQPLGNTVGNTLEIEETVDILKDKGPKDITKLVEILACQMAVLGEKASSIEDAQKMVDEVIKNGKALEKFKEMIEYQGGDSNIIDDYTLMPHAKFKIELPALKTGTVSKITADEVGIASMLLGGGRQSKDDLIDYGVGIKFHKKVGDKVDEGQSILTIYSNTENVDNIKELLYNNINIGNEVKPIELIHKIIQ